MSEEQQSQHLWMEDKLTGMDMIGDEHFEPTGELYDFLTESCSPPKNNSSLISSASSASSPSSFESSFAESIPEPSPNTEGAEGCVKMVEELLSQNVQEKPVEPIDFSELATEMETVDGSQQNTTGGDDIDAVSTTRSKLRQSRLQTPSKSLKNCSAFSSSPIKDAQLDYLKELRDFDTTKMALSSQRESQLSSGRSSSNDTYIVSQSSSEERASSDTALNELERSETSSMGSSVSVEGGKKLKPPKTGSSIARKSIGGLKFTKPTTKPSLLPSKPLNQSKSLLQQPLRKVGVPANRVLATKKNTSLRNQENKGILFVTSIPPSKVTKRVPVNKNRIRRSSIPKPVAVSELQRKQLSKNSNATRVLKSASVPVVQSTPIPLKNKAITDTTPNRRRSLATNSPPMGTREGHREVEPRIKPSFSLSSIEGSASAKRNETALIREAETSIIKTPKTVKKRRSLLPTPGGKELNILSLDIGTSDRKSHDAMQQQSSASPHLNDDERAMPPPKRSSKLQVKGYGLQKLTAGSRRMVFKPKNGPAVRPKKTGPVKPVVSYHREDFQMVPKVSGSKVVHSPLNKENSPSIPHSKWSPVKKKKDYERDDACFMCTKRTVK